MFKKIKNKLSWNTFERDLSALVARFPVSVIALFVLFGVASIMLHSGFNDQDLNYAILGKTAITSIFVALLSYAVVLGLESWKCTKRSFHIGSYIVVLLAGVLYYLYIPSTPDQVPFEVVFTLFSILGLVFVASFAARFDREYTKGDYQDGPFYLFVLSQVGAMLEGFFAAVFTFLLGAATLGSISALFGLGIDGEWYGQWWIIAATLVGPLYFLSHVPKEVASKGETLKVLGTFLRFVIMYIALPFILIYFVILYAYSIKVLLNFSQWPEGIVSWLVIFFSFFGWIIYFLSYHVRTERFVALFRKWFPYVLAPQLAMLFYAIGLRIAQHGVTVNRYFVVAFGIWIVLLCLYFIFSKKKALFVLPASLFVGLIITLVGPWGAFSVSEGSQVQKVQDLFNKYELIQDGSVQVISPEELTAIAKEDQESLISSIRYICENHGCDKLRDTYGDSYTKALDGATSEYNQSSNLLSYVGLPTYVSNNWERRNTFVSLYANTDGFVFPTSGYQSIVLVNSYERETKDHRIDLENGVRIFFVKDSQVISRDVTEQIQDLLVEKGTLNLGDNNIPESFDFNGGKFYVTNANAELQKDGSVKEVTNLGGYLLIAN